MQERDKALKGINDMIQAKENEIRQLESEIAGVMNEKNREQKISA